MINRFFASLRFDCHSEILPHDKTSHIAKMTGVEREGRILTPFRFVRNDNLCEVEREGVGNWARSAQLPTPSTIKNDCHSDCREESPELNHSLSWRYINLSW